MSKSEDYLKKVLNENSLEFYGKPFGELGNKAQSDNLSRLFVTQVLDELGHPDASEGFEDGYVDGGGDLTNDLIIKAGNEVHFIQTKFQGFGKKLPREYVDSFITILTRHENKSFDKHKNGRLKEILEDIQWDSDNLYFWFVTNSLLDNQAKTQAEEVPLVIPDHLKEKYQLGSDRIQVDYIDQERLYEILSERGAVDARQGVDGVEIFATKQSGVGRSSLITISEEEYKSVVMVVESEQIAKYCRGKSKFQLFDFNIRNYLGENKKNAQILLSARNNPERFYLYNNGVSAICENLDIDEKSGKIIANRFSVINGAQTIRSLAKLKGEAKPRVLLRVTEISHHKDRNDFLRNVVRFNNTQNEIKSFDFRSNDVIQQSFKSHFSTLVKDGRKCEYFPKRTDAKLKSKITYKIQMVNFAKAVFSYRFDPYAIGSLGTNVLFDIAENSRGYYKEIFGREDSSIDKDEFLIRAGSFFVSELLDVWLRKVRSQFKDADEDPSTLIEKNAIERKPPLLWVAHLLLSRLERENPGFNEDIFLKDLAQLNINNVFEDSEMMNFVRVVFETAKEMLTYEYQQLMHAGVSHRQWVKGYNNVKSRIETSVKTMPQLTTKMQTIIPKKFGKSN